MGTLQQQTQVYQTIYNLACSVSIAMKLWCLHRQAS